MLSWSGSGTAELSCLSSALENRAYRAGYRTDFYFSRLRFRRRLAGCLAARRLELFFLCRRGRSGDDDFDARGFRHIFEIIYLFVITFFLLEWALRSLRKRMVV